MAVKPEQTPPPGDAAAAATAVLDVQGLKTPPPQPEQKELHPYHFQASGPRNFSSPNWKDLFNSSWKDPNYKRMVIACFIQAVYLLELDRQENKLPEDSSSSSPSGGDALAPNWWKPFRYKLTQTLVDERDGSIYGAVLEWDRAAALSDLVLVRPSGAPRAVLALRGTLLKAPTIRRDIQDDLRFLAWESLKGSVRFAGALGALRVLVERYGGPNVCVGGPSLGAGFALQVGKALAKEGVFVECHLFNPPSVSVAMSLRSLGEKVGLAWSKVRGAVWSVNSSNGGGSEESGGKDEAGSGWWWPRKPALGGAGGKRWVPHLYVNNSDYLCCHYTNSASSAAAAPSGDGSTGKTNRNDSAGAAAAKMFVTATKGPQKFLQAHGLQQWWSDDMELQLALNHSELINRQLRSLYTAATTAKVA